MTPSRHKVIEATKAARTSVGHKAAAETLLDDVAEHHGRFGRFADFGEVTVMVAMAQVHATLALREIDVTVTES